MQPIAFRRALVLVLLGGYLVLLLDLALIEFQHAHATPNFFPLHTMVRDWNTGGREFVVNFLGNVIAFIPVGMIPAVAWPRRFGAGRSALFCMALSLMIETTQYATGRRVADVDDVILNTLGGVMGYFVLERSGILLWLGARKNSRRHAEGHDPISSVPGD